MIYRTYLYITLCKFKTNQQFLAAILNFEVKYCPYLFSDIIIEIFRPKNIEKHT